MKIRNLNPTIALFVPVYNEGKILENNILKLYKELKRISNNFEIIIVDDKSKDSVERISKKLKEEYPEIDYIRFQNGPSRRENLAEAMKHCNKDIIAYNDIDLAVDLRHLKRLIDEVKKGADIAIGSRRLGIKAKRGIFRRILSAGYNLFNSVFFGSGIKDHQCGFKAFRKEVIHELIKDAGYDKKFVRGWFWDAEILIRAQKKKFKIIEFPVRWVAGKDSSFQLMREMKMFLYFLKLKRNLK